MACYKKAGQLEPAYIEAAVKLASLYISINKKTLAAEQLSKAMDINEDIVSAYIGLAFAYHLAGRKKQSCDTIALAAAVEANIAVFLEETVKLLYSPGSNSVSSDEAFDIIKSRASQYPNDTEANYRYGILNFAKKNVKLSSEIFSRIIESNPTHHRALNKLAMSLADIGQKDKALNLLAKTKKMPNSLLDKLYKAAIMCWDKGNFLNAAKIFDSSQNTADLKSILKNLGLVGFSTL